MGNKIIPRLFFNKSAIARQKLADKAEEILDKYMKVLDDAQKMGEYEVAAKGYQWLLDHMPADTDGTRIINTSVDKPGQTERPTSNVQIGISLGGVSKEPKALPSITVEAVDAG